MKRITVDRFIDRLFGGMTDFKPNLVATIEPRSDDAMTPIISVPDATDANIIVSALHMWCTDFVDIAVALAQDPRTSSEAQMSISRNAVVITDRVSSLMSTLADAAAEDEKSNNNNDNNN
jgi:hypothetical protein